MTPHLDNRPTWELLVEAAHRLTDNGSRSFTRAQLIAHVQREDPSRERPSIDPIIQGMTENATGGPRSACGIVFRRIERGQYVLMAGRLPQPFASSAGLASPSPPVAAAGDSSPRRLRIHRRLQNLIKDFDGFVAEYDNNVPFQRSGQYEWHRRTIDRRCSFPALDAALRDDPFVTLLYETLQKWGIGQRASRLVPVTEFMVSIRAQAERLMALEHHSLESLAEDGRAVGGQVWACIESLAIVDNKSRVVSGTKTLHHLLPDLVPPMDGKWTGRFFEWSGADLRSRQAFFAAWCDLQGVAAVCRPSRLVGSGWRTSATKILDNAVVACAMR